uniref:Class I SAM-dependent methyltransferase n=1 Tax=candidate division CPR3 bacterium TaxID=2268181 RepID=A0A7C4R4E4_UNCC3
MEKQNISDYDKYNYDYQKYWDNKEINRNYENEAEKSALLKLFNKQNTLPSIENAWFCDLGSGFGRLFDVYKKYYKNIILIDYSLENLKKAKELIEKKEENSVYNVYFIAANAYQLPFKNESIDCLMSIRTIHHMEESEKFIDQIRSAIRSRGYLILEYANKRHFIEVLRGILGKSKMKPFNIEPYKRGDDLFFNFHPKYIYNKLSSGFSILKSISVSNFRSGLIKKIIPLKILLPLDRALQPFFNLIKFGPSIFILAQKKDHPKNEEEKEITEISNVLQCPHCGDTEMIILKTEVRCKKCEKRYNVIDGIYDFRI